MYYHIHVLTDETGEIYEFDHTELDGIIQDIIRPYIENQEFQIAGYFIDPSKVKRMVITQTDKDTEYYKKQEYQKQETDGYFFPISKEDFVFRDSNYYKDITRNVLKKVKDELTITSDKKTNNDSTSLKQDRKATIFLAYSYRAIDDEFVEGFKELLIDKGYRVLDGKADRLGSISQAILEKIRLSDIIVVVMTKRDKKENGKYTTAAWLLEEKGAAIALDRTVAMFVEEEVDASDIGGLQGDAQRFHFSRNNFLKVAMNFIKVIEADKEKR